MASAVARAWAERPTLAVELENKGSVARDHLAGERTFLAWLRTSLALVSLGVAIAQLFKLPEIIEPNGQADNGSDGGSQLMRWMSGARDDDPQASIFTASRLESLEKLGKPLGATCVALGALCLVLGAYRYYVVQMHLIRGAFPPSRVESAFIVAAFGIIVGAKLKS